MGEHLVCIQKVAGSIPVTSTKKSIGEDEAMTLLDALKNFIGIYDAPAPVEGDTCLVIEVKENKLPELRELTEKINNGG